MGSSAQMVALVRILAATSGVSVQAAIMEQLVLTVRIRSSIDYLFL